MTIRRICLYGGPGSGKSTTAAGVYYSLSKEGLDVELVREFIKEEMVYNDRFPKGFDQSWIFSSQMHREEKALRHNKIIVADCPVLVAVAYTDYYKAPCKDDLMAQAKKFEQQYPSLNIFLDREGIPYKDSGRYQNSTQALEVDSCLKSVLEEAGVSYEVIRTVDTDGLLSYIKRHVTELSDGKAA